MADHQTELECWQNVTNRIAAIDARLAVVEGLLSEHRCEREKLAATIDGGLAHRRDYGGVEYTAPSSDESTAHGSDTEAGLYAIRLTAHTLKED
jgi:hypothetical protein